MNNIEFLNEKFSEAEFALFELRNALSDYDDEKAANIESLRKIVEQLQVCMINENKPAN